MITRSGKSYNEDKYTVNIDFDMAHKEWIKNKIKLSDGCYKYIN